MSWLYTIVFAGLAFSSESAPIPNPDQAASVSPAAVEEVLRDETEKFEQTYPLNANGRVNISNVNGSITVEGWDRNEVKLEYTKVADSKERLADVEIRIEARPEFFSVETDYGNWKGKNSGERWRNGGKLNVDFRLMVPRGAVLSEVETVNGSVTVSNFVNITKVSAVNGSVNASNIRGTAKLSTVNGEVSADFDRLETSSKINLDTVNGRVNLVIPSDANATVRADSLNGNITNDFGLPVRKGKYVGRDLYGRLGAGEVQIRLNSVNGGLSIGRKNDGRSLSPATNLLPQKEKDDEDWNNDDLKSGRIDKEIAKAVKESSKVSTKVMADAKREMHKIQPEIARVATESVARTAEALQTTAEIFNSDDFKQKMKDAALKQKELLGKLADVSFFPTVPRVESKSGWFSVKGVPKVTVQGKGCSVTVRGWDKPEVKYRVTQFADPRTRTPLKIDADAASGSLVNIRVENPGDNERGGLLTGDARRVRIEVFVPRKSSLKITADGEIRLDGVSGDVELVGSDEPINVRDVDGKLRVSNADGRVRVIGFKGEIDSRTGDGDVYLEGDFSRITGNAGDGNFYLTLPADANADLRANVEALTIDNLPVPVTVREGHWRFGKGGPDYTFKVTDGQIFVRNTTSLTK